MARLLSFVFILLVLAVALWNNGFLATDEYWVAMVRYLPAQAADFAKLVTIEDVKAPTQNFLFVLFSKTALFFGIEHPYWQYRFVCWMTTLFALVPTLFAARRFLFLLGEKNWPWLLPLTASLYFCSGLVFSRAMYESLALPFMAWFFVATFAYDHTSRRKELLLAVVMIVGAFLMRPQTAGAAGALLLLCLLKKNYRDFFWSAGVGLGLFGLVGLIDLFVRGSWHFSFWQILTYNLASGGDYAKSSPVHLFVMSFIFVWGPVWIFSWKSFPWRKHFLQFRSAWLILLFFVGTHSFFAQKFERFLIPLVPIYLVLLTAFVVHCFENQKRISLGFLLALNLTLWIPANLSAPLGSLIEIVRQSEKHPEVTEIFALNKSIEWLPELMRNPPSPQVTPVDLENFRGLTAATTWLVVREIDKEAVLKIQPALKVIHPLPQNLFETWAYKLNPKRNQLRAPIYLLGLD